MSFLEVRIEYIGIVPSGAIFFNFRFKDLVMLGIINFRLAMASTSLRILVILYTFLSNLCVLYRCF